MSAPKQPAFYLADHFAGDLNARSSGTLQQSAHRKQPTPLLRTLP